MDMTCGAVKGFCYLGVTTFLCPSCPVMKALSEEVKRGNVIMSVNFLKNFPFFRGCILSLECSHTRFSCPVRLILGAMSHIVNNVLR